jgi:hypothetical protein
MTALTNCFSRIYRALLFTYPREFRLEYGGEMERVFRDRCRDAAPACGNESIPCARLFPPPGKRPRAGL